MRRTSNDQTSREESLSTTQAENKLSKDLWRPNTIVLTPRLILVPTPHAIAVKDYRTLYANLHADKSFTEMGFGKDFPAVTRSDEEITAMIQTRDVGRCWKQGGLGDFAVGLRPASLQGESLDERHAEKPKKLGSLNEAGQEVQEYDLLKLKDEGLLRFEEIEWAGYAGVRNAINTSMPDRTSDDPPLPPWQELVELRYGVSPKFWGKGLAKEAAEAVMAWAASSRGVRRFIAETERANSRSGKVLEKLGFKPSNTHYWKDPEELEWEKVVSISVS